MSLDNFIEIDPIQEISYYLNKKLREEKNVTIYYNLEYPYLRIDENTIFADIETIANFVQKLKQKYEHIEFNANNEIALTLIL
jgi:hypothetical protein